MSSQAPTASGTGASHAQMERDAGLHTATPTRGLGLQAPTPVQRPWWGLPAVLPVSRQGAVVIQAMRTPWPLGDLEAGEQLTAWNLTGGGGVG